MKYITLPLILLLLFLNQGKAQKATIYGKISNEKNEVLANVSISLIGTKTGTVSDSKGEYQLDVPANHSLLLQYSFLSYKVSTKSLKVNPNSKTELNITLVTDEKVTTIINITDKNQRGGNITRLNPDNIELLPSANGASVESLIKTLPGVTTRTELSSQYSVRGGNFDENLVYINDIEVYRPFLVRSGQQEGLSIVNPDMVSGIAFSAGGYEAKYDDKMSSVLDIKYRSPTKFGATVSGSLLGASATVGGISNDLRFSYISGIRYKTSKYLLGTLDTKGEYNPTYIDFQTFMTYQVNRKLELSFLGNVSQNSYELIPTNRITNFGTVNKVYSLQMYFDGQEEDRFRALTGAISANYEVSKELRLKFIAAGYQTDEKETFDISGQYLLNEIENPTESSPESVNLGVGTYLDHARNQLTANIFSLAHKGYYNEENNSLQWGVKAQQEQIEDKLSEWKLIDSSGYSLPYSDNSLQMKEVHKATIDLNTFRYTSYLQNEHTFDTDSSQWILNTGIRTHYWTYNNDFLISPRVSVAYFPTWHYADGKLINIRFRFSTGLYYQPAFYKELRDENGKLYQDLKAQRSIHYVLGNEYQFIAWGRPFKIVTELYYKDLTNLIPYEVDNLRIIYHPESTAKGYATGLDVKINGHFVKGEDSWVSFSLMNAQESIDGHPYQARPTSQLFTVGLFFQDYLPNNDSYKMHLNCLYGSPIQQRVPNSTLYSQSFSMPAYRRVDIGFSKRIIGSNKEDDRDSKVVKSLWLSAEIFNLLDISNTISYLWVTVVPNKFSSSEVYDQYSVPNYLTGRRLNLRLVAKF